jgi:hypothetical protein
MRRHLSAAMLGLSALLLVGCDSDPSSMYDHKARQVQACTAAGGEWYNTPGWGEGCNFDTRDDR